MATLTNLKAKLAGLVPARGGVPSDTQYEEAVRDAVFDFGRQVPRLLFATIAVVSGQATYTLPDGFIRIIELETFDDPDSVIRNNEGFLVTGVQLDEERYEISGGEITFYPTPTYTLNRDMRYAAGYPYDEDSDSFIGLTDDLARVVMLKARAEALTIQALSPSAGGVGAASYTLGDVRVDKSRAGDSFEKTINKLNEQFAAACKELRERGNRGRISPRKPVVTWY